MGASREISVHLLEWWELIRHGAVRIEGSQTITLYHRCYVYASVV